MRNILLIFISFAMLMNVTFASKIEGAEKIIKTALDQAILVLQKTDLDKASKKGGIMKIVNPIFDFGLMAKLSLGKKNWPKFNKEQKKEFKDLFIKQLQDSYFDKALLFSDEEIIYEPSVMKKNKVHVTTIILSKGEKFKLLYKMYFKNAEWKIYDLEIQDISVIKSYGSQYDQELANSSVEDLLKKMRDKKIQNNK